MPAGPSPGDEPACDERRISIRAKSRSTCTTPSPLCSAVSAITMSAIGVRCHIPVVVRQVALNEHTIEDVLGGSARRNAARMSAARRS